METNNNKTKKTRQILILILLPFTLHLLPFTPIFAQSDNQNYILTKTYTSSTAHNDVIQYYDGLGRPLQTVRKQFTPDGKDLVTRTEYDSLGRESKAWLPVPSNNNSNGAFDNTTNVASSYGNDSYAFSETVYEPSPLNRVNEQYGPGQPWRTAGRKVKTEYMANKLPSVDPALACIYYYRNCTNSYDGEAYYFGRNGYYAAGSLYVTKTTDEDNNISYEFKDKLGRTVLQRQMDGTERYDTYYVYDDFGNLSLVFPPAIADHFTVDRVYSFFESEVQPVIDKYLYTYFYDHRNRLAGKKRPGVGTTEDYVYDKADRLVFQRTPENEYIFTKYDALGRVILSGLYNGAHKDCDWLRNQFAGIVSKEQTENNQANHYYTWNTYPSAGEVEVTQVNYYDYYYYVTDGDWHLYSQEKTGYNDPWSSATGRLTGTKSRILSGNGNPDQWITTIYYYDYKGNMVQKRSTNHLGGYDYEHYAYNYNNLITKKYIEHNVANQPAIIEEYAYSYDTQLRLTGVTHSRDYETPVTIAQYTYNPLGQVQTKTTGGLETATYAYNIRGWVNSQTGNKFSENLYYTDNPKTGGNKYYGGNISALTWKSSESTSIPRGYSFEYNALGWLKRADYGEGSAISTNAQRYSELFTYDKMGNPLTLKRYGRKYTTTGSITFDLIDNLTMPAYIGNCLRQVDDAAGDQSHADLMEFKNGINMQGEEYIYYTSGALMSDYNRKICMFKYNYLTLPQSVQFRYGHRIEYAYDASGMKRTVKYKEANQDMNYYTWDDREPAETDFQSVQHRKDYTGNKVYENNQLKLILTENGYIEKAGNDYHRYYYLKDHLGNNRIVMNASGAVVQLTNYYPSGTVMAESQAREDQGVQPYKFNGKELDRTKGLDFYDYEARQFDPLLMRFTMPDPLQEKYYSISPFAYCNNNPVNAIDPTGMEWKTKDDEEYARILSQAMTEKRNSEFSKAVTMFGDYKVAVSKGETEKAATILANMKEIGQNISNLDAGVSELTEMGNTKDKTFTFNKIEGNVGDAGIEKGVVVMNIAGNGSIANGIHESSHGYDLWKGGYTKGMGGNYISGEIKAYSHQFSYDKSSLPVSDFGRINSLNDINNRWVLGIQSSGEYIYIKKMYPERNPKDILKSIR